MPKTLAEQLEKIGLDKIDRSGWPQTLLHLAEIIDKELKRQGLIDDDAGEMPALCVALAIADPYGGTQYYIPVCDKVQASIRNAQIWREYTGRNREELAARYGLTIRQIQTIVAEERARRHHKQRGLFDDAA